MILDILIGFVRVLTDLDNFFTKKTAGQDLYDRCMMIAKIGRTNSAKAERFQVIGD